MHVFIRQARPKAIAPFLTARTTPAPPTSATLNSLVGSLSLRLLSAVSAACLRGNSAEPSVIDAASPKNVDESIFIHLAVALSTSCASDWPKPPSGLLLEPPLPPPVGLLAGASLGAGPPTAMLSGRDGAALLGRSMRNCGSKSLDSVRFELHATVKCWNSQGEAIKRATCIWC